MLAHTIEEQTFETWTGEYENDRTYVGEGLAADVVEQVLRILQERGLNQPWLAKQLGVTRQSVNRIFQAAPNMQLQTIAGLAIALGIKPKIIMDSGNYIIKPIDTALDFEDFQTDQRIQLAQRDFGSTDDTTFAITAWSGASSHGTA